jgi:hypothetical protein
MLQVSKRRLTSQATDARTAQLVMSPEALNDPPYERPRTGSGATGMEWVTRAGFRSKLEDTNEQTSSNTHMSLYCKTNALQTSCMTRLHTP